MVQETLDVGRASEWRSWLGKNHNAKDGVWLVFYKKDSGHPSITYEDAVDEALAYGWIDSVIKKIDDRKYARKFTPRRPGSVWSKYNLARVAKLHSEGKMTEWGLAAFWKRTGKISLLEQFGSKPLRVPRDLVLELKKNERAWENFANFGPSHRKRYLIWISDAKKAETRKKRIDEAVILISQNVRDLLK